MDAVFNRLTAWLAPILCFTAEEAWQSRHSDIENSVHLRSYDPIPTEWHDNDVAERWAQIRRVTSSNERIRVRAKRWQDWASLQAAPTVYVSNDALSAFAGQDAASLFHYFVGNFDHRYSTCRCISA